MQKYFWTAEEDEYIRNNYENLGPKRCSENMGRLYQAVQLRARQMNITQYSHIDWDAQKVEFLKTHYGTKPALWLSQQLQIPKTAIQKKVEQLGLKKEWKNFYVNDGYVYTGKSRTPNRYAEHRKVMEGILGRKLTPQEIVHHINEDRKDNRPENLELVTRAEHVNMHRNVVRRKKHGADKDIV